MHKKKTPDGTPGAEAQTAAEVVDSGTAGAPAAPLPDSASSSGQEEQDIEADILGSLCESLDRLQTDYVDLYLLHCPFEAFNVDKSLQEDAKRLADNLFPEDDNLSLHGTNKATAATAELHQQAGSLELFRSRMRHANQICIANMSGSRRLRTCDACCVSYKNLCCMACKRCLVLLAIIYTERTFHLMQNRHQHQ